MDALENNHFQLTASDGLVCDNPNCDHEEPNVKPADYENWIDAPCPCCGESLLTREDLNAYNETLAFLQGVSNMLDAAEANPDSKEAALVAELTQVADANPATKNIDKLRISFNGSGRPQVETIDNDEAPSAPSP